MEQAEIKGLALVPSHPGHPCSVLGGTKGQPGCWEHRSLMATLAFLPFLKHIHLLATPGFGFYCVWVACYWLHWAIQGSFQMLPPPKGPA